MSATALGNSTETEMDLAYHEAGHAVVAWANGVGLTAVQLGAVHGYVIDRLRWRPINPITMTAGEWKYAKAKALILLAGEFAERAYHDWIGSPSIAFCSDGDREQLGELLHELFEDCAPCIGFSIAELEGEADELVQRHWDRIEALARCLLAQRSLTGAEAEQTIKSVITHGRWLGHGPIVWEDHHRIE